MGTTGRLLSSRAAAARSGRTEVRTAKLAWSSIPYGSRTTGQAVRPSATVVHRTRATGFPLPRGQEAMSYFDTLAAMENGRNYNPVSSLETSEPMRALADVSAPTGIDLDDSTMH